MLACGSAAADTITQADADRIADAIAEQMTSVLTSMPVSFGPADGVISQPMTVPNGMPLGVYLARVLGWDESGNAIPPDKPIVQLLAEMDADFAQFVTDWATARAKGQLSLDALESLLMDIEAHTKDTAKDTDGVWDKLDDIATFSESLADMMTRPASQHLGYQTENLNGELAVSVRDADTASALESLQDALHDGLDGVGNSLDGLATSFDALLVSNLNVSVVGLSSESGAQIADSIASKSDERLHDLQTPENQPQDNSDEKNAAEYLGKSTADGAAEDLTSYTGDNYELPTYEPDTSGLNLDANLVPRATIPNLSPASQDVTVFEGMDVNRLPGWQGLAGPITWKPWNRQGTSRVTSLFEQAGRVMRGVWEIAFAVWLFLLVRREVLFYMTLGQEDTPSRPDEPFNPSVTGF